LLALTVGAGGAVPRIALRSRLLPLHRGTLDPESTGEVLRVMRELAEDGMTVLLVTHELPFAQEVSDWVVFLDRGLIVEQGPPIDVLQHP
jgi:ABC-type histidine transport system ATPase subunit